MPDESALSDSDRATAAKIGFGVFRDSRSWTAKTPSSSTVLLTLLGTLSPSTTAASHRGFFVLKNSQRRGRLHPMEFYYRPPIRLFLPCVLFFFSLPHLNGNVVVWGFACWKTSFPFLQLFWGSIWVHAVIKGSVAWTWLLMLVLSFISRVVTGESLCLCVPISLPLKEGHGHPKDSSLKAL